ncbi:S8 family serine peptidase [Cylindrospermopsis raciborskii]|uniref:S8 family serine peptidase n=1 Tax=Cylindrospermopsis raciborskii TaxID=77022 RepID=UPI0026EAD888|nr:S8 family serine peptidase [Cylindrospermopsis raciborskii]
MGFSNELSPFQMNIPIDEGSWSNVKSVGYGLDLEQSLQYGNQQVQSLPLPPTTLSLLDNTRNTASNIGTLTGSQTFLDFVGSSDTNDYYRFDLSQTSNFNLSLTGLSADADTQLLNSSGTVIQSSQNGGTASESISRNLKSGTYYVRVYSYSGNTNYTLTLSGTPTDQAGNTLATARNIGNLTSNQTFSDFVGSSDTNDYYRFDLNQTSTFNLTLNGLSADADTQLLNSSGTVIQSSQNGSTASESISRTLNAGTYYVRVYPYRGNTNYTLTLSAVSSPLPPTSGFNSTYGYGLINAPRSVAAALGQSIPFPDVANLGGNNWGNDLVGSPEVWSYGYTGQGVVVAVVDTGVDYTHSDLDANIWINTREVLGNGIDDDGNGYIDDIRGWDFVGNDNDPMDGNSHGTHVAGTIAAENNGTGATGVAYNARIMAVRVLDSNGSGSSLGVANGIRYAVDNGARVINLSLGGSYSSDIYSAIQYATGREAIVVMAAGNSGASKPDYPAFHATEYGLAIGAVDSNGNIASFSNRAGTNSAMRYVVAPGVNIYSTVPNNGYATYSGTSMAAPHAAGVVALMLSANSSLTPVQVRNIVTGTNNVANISSLGTDSQLVTAMRFYYVEESVPEFSIYSTQVPTDPVIPVDNNHNNGITIDQIEVIESISTQPITAVTKDNYYIHLDDSGNYLFSLSIVLGLFGRPLVLHPRINHF